MNRRTNNRIDSTGGSSDSTGGTIGGSPRMGVGEDSLLGVFVKLINQNRSI